MFLFGSNFKMHRGWAIALSCFLASSVMIGGSQYSFGHFVEPLETEFGWSRTQIGISLSLIAFGSFISPFIGRMIDKHGARNIMSLSIAVFSISYLMRPFMTELWHWYALGVVQSFSMVGGAMLPPGKLVGLWFPRNRGKILSVTAMGNNFGGMAVQPLLAFLIVFFSWKAGYGGLGILGILVAVLCFAVVRNPVFIQDEGSGSSEDTSRVISGYTLSQALRTKLFYSVLLAAVCGGFTYSALLPQVYPHLIINGISEGTAALAVTVFATCGMFGKFVLGAFSDKYGPRLALIIDLIGQSVFVCLMVYAGKEIPLWLVVPFMGFFLGAFGALYELIVIESFGVRYFGSIMGVVAVAHAIPSFAGPVIAGLSYDSTDGYGLAFFVTGVIFAVGALSLIVAGQSITAPEDLAVEP